MSFMALSPGECGTGPHAALDELPVRQAAYQVEFYLIYTAIGVAGFKMSWTAREHGDDDRHGGSNLCLVRELSTTGTSSTATHSVQWNR